MSGECTPPLLKYNVKSNFFWLYYLIIGLKGTHFLLFSIACSFFLLVSFIFLASVLFYKWSLSLVLNSCTVC